MYAEKLIENRERHYMMIPVEHRQATNCRASNYGKSAIKENGMMAGGRVETEDLGSEAERGILKPAEGLVLSTGR